ncbi:hypothetical protein AB0D14_32680 [Streptomyces sp. NPDC048484]|uniref:hypothetical protein n=1 Tax=Streptomyces sp. NPDC048484 TaxID=3155146 RepID=UPI0034147545
MPDIADPRYFHQLAHTLDRITAELPTAEQLRRGDDISPAIHTLVGDTGCILADISAELATSCRHEVYDRPAHGPAERHGTAALTQCAVHLGAVLGHLGQVIERLGFLHQHLLQPGSGPRIPTPAPERDTLHNHFGQVATLLRTGAQQLRTTSEELSRIRTSPPTAGTPSPSPPAPAGGPIAAAAGTPSPAARR